VSTSVITFGASSYTAGNQHVGGFAGYNGTAAANYSNNYYLGTVGANGYFATEVARRVSSGSGVVINDDAQIRKIGNNVPQAAVTLTELNKEVQLDSFANTAGTGVASVEYVSSNPAIVQVASSDINGAKIKAVGAGDATITVIYKNASGAEITRGTTQVLGIIPIATAADFNSKLVAANMSRSFIQTASFDLPNAAYTPKGDATTPFSGIYDGGGFTIDAKNVPATSWQTVTVDVYGMYISSGLFGKIGGGSVKNMTINNVTASVTGSTGYVYAGAVAAFADRGAFERITVNNVNLAATNPSGYINMGGAFGGVYSSNFDNCVVNGSITGNATNISNGGGSMGGFVGSSDRCNVKNSVANVDVTDNSAGYIYTGGFVGRSYRGKYVGNRCSGKINITQTAAASINNELSVGGFEGRNSRGSMRNNISSSVITFG
ncbi:MAG: hypothetical protein RR956_08335, partial [Christensenella sp.]